MSGRHTPGPWSFREPNGRGMGYQIPETGAWFGSRTLDPETLANVRLCAASPDLLEALESCATRMECAGLMATDARFAIAKARGEK